MASNDGYKLPELVLQWRHINQKFRWLDMLTTYVSDEIYDRYKRMIGTARPIMKEYTRNLWSLMNELKHSDKKDLDVVWQGIATTFTATELTQLYSNKLEVRVACVHSCMDIVPDMLDEIECLELECRARPFILAVIGIRDVSCIVSAYVSKPDTSTSSSSSSSVSS